MLRTCLLLSLAIGAYACTFANAPEEILPAPSSIVTSGGADGGMGGTDGSGGSGGTSSAGGSGGALMAGGSGGTSNVGGSGEAGGAGGSGGSTTAVCGNGIVETGEFCDEAGNATATCDPDCTAVECGDGIRNDPAGEACDDNNLMPNDACSATCDITPFVIRKDANDSYHVPSLVQASVARTQSSTDDQFLVVYNALVGTGHAVERIVYDAVGAVASMPVTISTLANTDAKFPHVASNGVGRAIATWFTPGSTSGEILRYRVIEPGGQAGGNNESTVSGASNVLPCVSATVVGAPSGEFCMQWYNVDNSQQQAHCLTDMGQLVTGGLSSLGAADTSSNICESGLNAISAKKSGFLVTWFDNTNQRLIGRGLKHDGSPANANFQIINIPDSGPTAVGNAAYADKDEHLIVSAVIKDEYGNLAAHPRALTQRLDANLSATGAPALVSANHVRQNSSWVVRNRASGEYVVVWSEQNNVVNQHVIKARLFDTNGTSFGNLTIYDGLSKERCGTYPRATINKNGDVMFVWLQYGCSATSIQPAPTQVMGAIYPGLLPNP